MPAVTTAFLAAINGTTHDANIDVAVTSQASGARNLSVEIVNECFTTIANGAFKIGALAHSILATPGAIPAPAGNGVIIGATTYAVTVNAGTGYVEVQQTSP